MTLATPTKLDRRHVLGLTGATALAFSLSGTGVFAQSGGAPGPFALDPLAYPANALEPIIDARTMELHHDRHHAAYVAGLNAAVKDHGQVAAMPLESILAKINEMPETIRPALRNYGGGHANHSMYWRVMGQVHGKPEGDIGTAIDASFGGLPALQDHFNAAGSKLFGSGWVFVVVDQTGLLSLMTKPNQGTPLMDGKRVLFGADVWEHAYYLNYQNRRADYLKAWWSVIDWDAIARRYADAKTGRLSI